MKTCYQQNKERLQEIARNPGRRSFLEYVICIAEKSFPFFFNQINSPNILHVYSVRHM